MKTNLLCSRVGAAVTIIGSLTFTALPASAIFTGPYAPANWNTTVTSGGAVGTAEFGETNEPNDTLTFTFNSGPAGSYIERTITISSTQADAITFSWLFESAGLVGAQSAGYVVNSTYTPLVIASGAVDSEGNPIPIPSVAPFTLTVNTGQTFGFRFSAVQDSSSEGYFDITNFSAQPVPLETDAIPVVAGALFFGAGVWVKRKFKCAPTDPNL
ncbi:MAG: hypothetical protein ACK5CA_01490 [Cyanobacteriota bacterium]|jgi:hypothetical protein